jgi:2-polyprenyl-6-methoxyphenol hydroxylase-like FAD-dependent oxidoreductase
LIFRRIEGKVETIFGDSVTCIEQSEGGACVTFESGVQRRFDLVVGADGLHSRIRELVFGRQDQFEKYLGYKVAAFEIAGYRPRNELVYLMFTEVGQQASRFSMRGDHTMFLFIIADPSSDGIAVGDVAGQKRLLRKRLGTVAGSAVKFSTPLRR